MANKTHPTAVLKIIVAYVSYPLTGIGTLGASHSSSLQEILQLFALTRRLGLKDLLRAIATILFRAVRYSVVPHNGLPV